MSDIFSKFGRKRRKNFSKKILRQFSVKQSVSRRSAESADDGKIGTRKPAFLGKAVNYFADLCMKRIGFRFRHAVEGVAVDKVKPADLERADISTSDHTAYRRGIDAGTGGEFGDGTAIADPRIRKLRVMSGPALRRAKFAVRSSGLKIHSALFAGAAEGYRARTVRPFWRREYLAGRCGAAFGTAVHDRGFFSAIWTKRTRAI